MMIDSNTSSIKWESRMIRQQMNIEQVAKFINAQTPETKIYIGGDSERFMLDNVWHADYTLAIVIH